MHNCKVVKRTTRSSISPSKLVNTCKLGKSINVKVQLISSSNHEKSRSIPLKMTPSTTIASSCYSEDIPKPPIKVFVSLSGSSPLNPDDFIEPAADLSIPSTSIFLQHRNLSEPVPAIVDQYAEKKHILKSRLVSKNSSTISNSVQTSSVKNLSNKLVSQSLNTRYYKIVTKTPSKTILRKFK